jgi:hypothetical protein
MRDRIILIAGLLFIGACALFVFIRIESQYSPPDAPAGYFSPPPLVPSATATTPARPASTTARPRRTVTTWVTVTPHPVASTGGEDGR